MSLAELKEIEDTRNVLANRINQLNIKIQEKVETYTTLASSQFTAFFKSNNFTVTEKNRNIIANYGSLSATFLPVENKMGAYVTFHLTVAMPNKAEYLILLTRKDNKKGYSSRDPNDIINELNKEIEETETRLDNFRNEKWVFIVSEPKIDQQFDDIYDILNFIIR